VSGFARPRFEVADVVRAHAAELRLRRFVTHREAKVLRHVGQCRTPSLGGHRDVCDGCGHEKVSYNSCRDRHCPKCQGTERAKWLERRLEHVLPKLTFHPHVHCVVTGGGLSKDGARWVAAREQYLLPVKPLSRLFRGKFLAVLQDLRRTGELNLPGKLEALRDASTWAAFRDRLYAVEWVVYCKPPFGGPEKVFAYLGRYTHRVAISNHRIREFGEGRVTFAYRDCADGNRGKELTVLAVEFLRRFLLHVLPRRFVRLRHYGLHASGNVGTKLVRARQVLGPQKPPAADAAANVPSPSPSSPDRPERIRSATPAKEPWWETLLRHTGVDVRACPHCKTGRLIRQPLAIPDEQARGPPAAS